MRAMTVVPGNSTSAGVGEIPEPDKADGSVLVEGLHIGIRGTDVEIVNDGYGAAPDGVGSVNAAKRDYATAVDSLAAADRSWLERLVSRTVPLSDWPSALNKTPDDIKVAVDLQD